MTTSTYSPLLISELINDLGVTLVSFMAKVRDRQLPLEWVRRESEPSSDEYLRLHTAHEVFEMIADLDGRDMARNWMIGANPSLECTLAEAIRNDRLSSVVGSAQNYTYDGGGF